MLHPNGSTPAAPKGSLPPEYEAWNNAWRASGGDTRGQGYGMATPPVRAPLAPKTPAQPPSGPQYGGGQPRTSLNYQTGMNASGQPINSGDILGRIGKEQGPRSQFQGVNDQVKANVMADQATMGRDIQKQNSQQALQNQIARSELYSAGVNNMAKIQSDLIGRGTSQMDLATQLQINLLQGRAALAQSLLG